VFFSSGNGHEAASERNDQVPHCLEKHTNARTLEETHMTYVIFVVSSGSSNDATNGLALMLR
jgi:hypothetical protein